MSAKLWERTTSYFDEDQLTVCVCVCAEKEEDSVSGFIVPKKDIA